MPGIRCGGGFTRRDFFAVIRGVRVVPSHERNYNGCDVCKLGTRHPARFSRRLSAGKGLFSSCFYFGDNELVVYKTAFCSCSVTRFDGFTGIAYLICRFVI
jgi:hypothetical protein